MTATNHALTGALIGLTVGNPWIALPAAFASHFVLDAIPHFGFDERHLAKDRFIVLLICEAAACLALVLLLALAHPQHWATAAIGAFVATSPDFLWLPLFVRARTGQPLLPRWRFMRTLLAMQWFQRPIGMVVELAWLISFGYLVFIRL